MKPSGKVLSQFTKLELEDNDENNNTPALVPTSDERKTFVPLLILILVII